MADAATRDCIARYNVMKTQKADWDTHFQELAELVYPQKANITQEWLSPTTEMSDRLYDTTATRSMGINAAGTLALTTPRNDRWFIYLPPRKAPRTQRIRKYYAECTEIVTDELETSTFYEAIHESYLARTGFGTSCLYFEPGERDLFSFQNLSISSYMIAEDHEHRVVVVAREYELTLQQIIGRFGVEKLHPKMQRQAFRALAPMKSESKLLGEKYKILHFVRPRQGWEKGRYIDAKGMPFESRWIDIDNNHTILESGFEEFPYIVSRYEIWDRRLGPYGWSPTWLCRAEIAQLNLVEQWADYLTELKAFPRVLAPSTMEGEVDQRAGMTTYYDPYDPNQSKPEEWMSSADMRELKDRADHKREAIERAYATDMFQMFATLVNNRQAPPTATQAVFMESEKLIQFSPTFGRLTTEQNNPLLQRAFGIAGRAGALPEPPPELVEWRGNLGTVMEPKPEYVSKVSLALRAKAKGNLGQLLEIYAPLIAAQPDALDLINLEKQLAEDWMASGLTEANLRDPEDVAAMRAQRAEQQAMLEQSEMLMNASRAAGGVMEKQSPEKLAQLADAG